MLDFRAWLLRPVLEKLNHLKALHMTTNAEVIATIESIGAQVDKARLEVTNEFAVLTAKLEAALAGAGVADPTVVDALIALKAKSQAIDDVVPDAAPAPEPAPTPAPAPEPEPAPIELDTPAEPTV
jgi:hypothetical protein